MSNVNVVKKKENRFAGRKMWFLFAAIAAVVTGLLALGLMQLLTAKESYYVVAADIPARTEITPDLLEEVVVAQGSTPPNTLSPADLSMGGLYSLYTLRAGDVLSESNVGGLTPLSAGLPDNYVVASFTIPPSLAASGNVRRGDYVDIMAILPEAAGGDGVEARYVLQRVLVLDATVNLDTYQGEEATADEAATGESATGGATSDQVAQRSGIPEQYTVGLTQEHAARLAVATQFELFVVLSSVETASGTISDGPGFVSLEVLRNTEAPDAGEGTDRTFGSGELVEAPAGEETTDGGTQAPTTPEETPQAPTTPEEGVVEETIEEPTTP